MPTSFDADFRVFIHNPKWESEAGGPAVRYQQGPQRSGTMEWRSNDRDAARRKAQRIAWGEDADNRMKPKGWVTLQQNIDGDWKSVEWFDENT